MALSAADEAPSHGYSYGNAARWGNSEHSTCTASKAVGRNSGAARHATLVVVKSMNTAAGKAEVFETIAQDIVSKGRNHHSVVSTSYSDNRVDRAVAKSNSDIMLLVRRGVPVIVGAGNSGPGFVTGWPARLGDRKDNLWGPIVVGAVDMEGNKAPWSQELEYGRMLWAPGVDIECAKPAPSVHDYVFASGTSFAAPLVAGVVAEELTWMNHLGFYHPARRNQYIYDRLQWKRPSGLPVIWNGMDGTKPDPRTPRQPEDEGRSTS